MRDNVVSRSSCSSPSVRWCPGSSPRWRDARPRRLGRAPRPRRSCASPEPPHPPIPWSPSSSTCTTRSRSMPSRCSRSTADGWRTEAAQRRRPAPRSDDGRRDDRRRPTVSSSPSAAGLAGRGPPGPAGLRRPARRRRSAAGGCGEGGGSRGRAVEGQRAPHRPAGRGLARPAHTARLDQGVGHLPARRRCRVATRGRTREFCATIDEETDRLASLVANLLDMSRLHGGSAQRPPPSVGLEEIVPAALASLGDRARHGRVDVDDPRDAAPRRRRSRPCSNGRSRTSSTTRSHGRRRSSRSGSRPARSPSEIHLRVIDRGPGIPVADRERMFEPFQRLGDRLDGAGVGLGLAVAQGFIRAVGGDLVPRRHTWRRHHDGRARCRSRSDGTPPGARGRRRAADPARARRRTSERGATRSTTPRRGSRRSSLAARHHPDVVILDLGLPGIDGIEVVRGLRGWSQVPIIVLSARDGEAAKVAALDAGADDYVTKPFGMDELLARLRAALRRATPADEEAGRRDRRTSRSTSRQGRCSGTVRRCTSRPTEWHVLEVLVRHPGKLVTQRQLLQEVWGPDYETETNYLRLYLAQLRRKLEPEPGSAPLPHHRTGHGLSLPRRRRLTRLSRARLRR